MAIAFPQNPVDGDKYTVGGIVYGYSDGAWRLSSDNAKAAIHVGTEPPENPQQGDLWFHSGEADLKIYYVDSTSSQWIPASSPPDPYEENFVSISGDTMSGDLSFDGNKGIKFNTDNNQLLGQFYRSSNTNIKTEIYSGGLWGLYCKNDNNGSANTMIKAQFRTGDSEATLNLYHVADPAGDSHAANKKYVDDEISQLKSNHQAPVGVPGTPYKYANRYDNNLADGEFHIEGSSAVQLSRISLDGVEMSHYGEADYSASVRCMVIVRDKDGRVIHAIGTRHIYVEGSNRRIRHSADSTPRNGKADMVVGETYWVTDGFFNF